MRRIFVFLSVLFYANFAFGYITENVPGGCLYGGTISAIFELNQHTCAPGYFLPANYDGCVSCPADATCTGGTFTFNERIAQGVVYNQTIAHNISYGCAEISPLGAYTVAIFTPNVRVCSPGYYMPANTDGCVACPVNSYCPGGTFTFNETLTQGIDTCPTGTVAPSGMWELEQCGRTLHLGTNTLYLRTSKKTSPALSFDFDGDGVADLYANVTTDDTVMNRDSLQKLKIKIGNTIYSVYDDTVE